MCNGLQMYLEPFCLTFVFFFCNCIFHYLIIPQGNYARFSSKDDGIPLNICWQVWHQSHYLAVLQTKNLLPFQCEPVITASYHHMLPYQLWSTRARPQSNMLFGFYQNSMSGVLSLTSTTVRIWKSAPFYHLSCGNRLLIYLSTYF